MFRNRIVLAALLALAILPLVGCANRRCCDRPVSYSPVVVAPAPPCGGPAPLVP
jgi:hypothetical protein